MAYWIKITDDRNEYIIDLDQISAFACAPNGKITFWLPDSTLPLIINRQSNPEGYQQVLKFIQNIDTDSPAGAWLKVIYDRNEYIVDLNRLSAFCHAPTGKITFWLPDSRIPVIINKQSDPDTYQRLIDFIKRKTSLI